MTTEYPGGGQPPPSSDDASGSTRSAARPAFVSQSATDYAGAMISLYRSDPASPRAGWPGSLDVVLDQLTLELRLFPGFETDSEAESDARPHLIVDNDFRVKRRIGSGGMGSVYLAWSESLQRDVALKVPHTGLEGSLQEHRLLREARCLARVRHGNIVHVYQVKADAAWHVVRDPDDSGPRQRGRTAVIVMEYFEGQTIEAWLQTARPWRDIVGVFLQAARGLSAAHGRGLLHSDITLRNILIDRQQAAKLIDFGLSKPQAEGSSTLGDATPWAPVLTVEEVSGTPGFAAPEQLQRGNTVDARSDLFSLGVALWRALSGSLPYTATALTPGTEPGLDTRSMLMRETWPRTLPGWLRDLLTRCLDFDRARRPASMARFIAAVEAGRTAPTRSPLRWFAGSCALALSTSLMVAMTLRDGPPLPFTADDPGVELVWNEQRAQRVETALARSPELERGRPELRRGIEAFAAAWTATRAEIQTKHLHSWPATLQRQAGLCLLESRHDFDRVLRAIEATATHESGPAAPALLHTWLLEMRPPVRCQSPLFTGNIAMPSADALGWSTLYTRGYQSYLEHDLERADYHFRRSLELAGSDPVGAARVHFRLAMVGHARTRPETERAHLHAALALTENGGDPYLRLYVLKELTRFNAVEHPEAALGYYASALEHLRPNAPERGEASMFAAELSELHIQAAWAVTQMTKSGQSVVCPLVCDDPTRRFASCAPPRPHRRPSPGEVQHRCATDLVMRAYELVPPGSPQRAQALMSLAAVELANGDADAAERPATAAVSLDAANGVPTSLTPTVNLTLASILAAQGRPTLAEASLRRALAALEATGKGDGLIAADTARMLAALALHRGDHRTARVHAERAREILERHGMPSAQIATAIEIHDILGELYVDLEPTRDESLGIERLQRGLALAALARRPLDHDHARFVATMYQRMAGVALRRGDASQAQAWLAACRRHLVDAVDADLGPGMLPMDAEAERQLRALPSARPRAPSNPHRRKVHPPTPRR